MQEKGFVEYTEEGAPTGGDEVTSSGSDVRGKTKGDDLLIGIVFYFVNSCVCFLFVTPQLSHLPPFCFPQVKLPSVPFCPRQIVFESPSHVRRSPDPDRDL